MKVVATIEARMTSSRLPGKVLLEAGGKSLLAHLVSRVKQVPKIDQIVVATTSNSTDDVLEEFGKKHGISVFRGSEHDVMSRVIGAAESVNADILVSLTGDCPLLDPALVDQALRTFLANQLSYVVASGSYPDGMDTQVFRLSTLKRSSAMTQDPLDREHVTRHMRIHPDLFPQVVLQAPRDLHWPELGLTIDEPKDFEFLKKIIDYFGPQNPYFGCREVVKLLRETHPEWLSINHDVHRKGLHT